jgi:hypothetical protein
MWGCFGQGKRDMSHQQLPLKWLRKAPLPRDELWQQLELWMFVGHQRTQTSVTTAGGSVMH